MPGSTTITASPSRIRVTVPAPRASSPSRPTYASCSANTEADAPGAIFASATEPTLPTRDQAGQSGGTPVSESGGLLNLCSRAPLSLKLSQSPRCAKRVFRADVGRVTDASGPERRGMGERGLREREGG